MSRYSRTARAGFAAGALLAWGCAALAQEQGGEPVSAEPAGGDISAPALEMNSEACGFTFFTDDDDRIDFRQSAAGSCFDMLSGADMLVVDPSRYPTGIKVFTGPGRDTTWASDGPDRVIDAGAEDAEIRTYAGNDVIELHPPVDEDPFRSVETTARTEIRAGAGENKIRIGKNVYSSAFARVSPNAWIWTEPGATDDVAIECGRPQDPETFDLRVMEVPETSHLVLDANGCGVGLFGQFGRTEITQLGGRFALRTQGEKFRLKAGEDLPRITGSAIAGTGAFLDITLSDPNSSFRWQGRDEAVVRADVATAASGGAYEVVSTRGVLFEGRPGPGSMAWTLRSEGTVELGIEGVHGATAERFELLAPKVFIRWRYEGGAAFPRIEILERREVRMAMVEPRVIEFYEGTLTEKAQAMFSRAMGFAEDEPKDRRTAEDLPSGVVPLSASWKTEAIETKSVSLALDLRRFEAADGDCFSATLVDKEGAEPTLTAGCNETVSRLEVDAARGYDQILLSGPENIVIVINEPGGLRVDRLSIDM